VIRRRLERIRRTVERRRLDRAMAGPKVIRAFADAYPSAFFVEIGANDGLQHDHLRPFILDRGWRGIMVEPVPYIFKRLESNYGKLERVALENAAVGDRDGTLPFYCLVDADAGERARLPDWYDGIGSFSREKVLAHARDIPDIAERVTTLQVRSLTFDSLCRAHGGDEVDLLLIDTEGYDAEILRSVDFAVRKPRLIIYEHFHLKGGDRGECRAMLEQAGYETFEEGFDTFCLMSAGGDALDRCWAGLTPAVPGVSVEDER
jgi:FkbM family methyltransferase